MKQKRRKLSMKVKDGLGPACPTCALPMQRWKHDAKWKPPARYYVLVRVPERGLQDQAGGAARGQSRHVRGLDAKPTMMRQEIVAARHADGRTLLPTPRSCRPRCVRQRVLEPFAVPGYGL
jgi:hypothetical protein